MESLLGLSKADTLALGVITLAFLIHFGLVPESWLVEFILSMTGVKLILLWASMNWNAGMYQSILNMLILWAYVALPAIFWDLVRRKLPKILKASELKST